jgi:hypothetical protein
VAGLGAGVAVSFLACPTELMKCRLQAQASVEGKAEVRAQPSTSMQPLAKSCKLDASPESLMLQLKLVIQRCETTLSATTWRCLADFNGLHAAWKGGACAV